MKVIIMNLTTLMGALPEKIQVAIQPITRQPLMPTGLINCVHSQINGMQLLLGIKRVETIPNPLKGRIYHLSSQKREYFAAMGRTDNGAIDFSDTDLIFTLKHIIDEQLRAYHEHSSVISEIARLRDISHEIMIRDIAECADDIEDLPATVLPGYELLEAPAAFQYTVEWLKSNLKNWRLRAFFDRKNSFFHLLDVHRFGEVLYSLSGTKQQSIAIVTDEALWVPDDDIVDEIEGHCIRTSSEKYNAVLETCKHVLAQYNAYLKQQVFAVVTYKLEPSSNTYIEISSSAPAFGFNAVSTLMQHMKESDGSQH